jgi:hypothetical protein
MLKIFRLFLLILLTTLAACSSSGPDDTTDAPPVQTPPAATPPAATVETVAYGRNDDGTFFYGAPDAPVTLIDYSDFL